MLLLQTPKPGPRHVDAILTRHAQETYATYYTYYAHSHDVKQLPAFIVITYITTAAVVRYPGGRRSFHLVNRLVVASRRQKDNALGGRDEFGMPFLVPQTYFLVYLMMLSFFLVATQSS